MSVKIIDINEDNIEDYGLFCKKSQKKEKGYQNKVKWINERLKEGLKYKLLWVSEGYKKETSRGFIEYIPGEFNWRGINANGWMVIHCLWITGKFKNKGYGMQLLKEAITDAKEKKLNGVAVVTSQKCSGLSKKFIFENAGFEKVDELRPNFELYALIFSENTSLPKFYPLKNENVEACGDGVTLLDGCQCPYVQTIVDPLEEYANSANVPFRVKTLNDGKEAQRNGITPYGVYGVVYNGEVISYCFPRRITDIVELIKKKRLKES
ncbi:MAG: GNAT family N-acetyltransferase [Promethearchaeota archaeon]